jgi:glucokinase
MQINNNQGPYILTADIGGSHITTGICELGTYFILPDSLARTGLSSKASAKIILDSWSDAFRQTIKSVSVPISGLALAMPGPFDYDKGISYIKGLNKYEAIYGMDIKAHLAEELNLHPDHIRFRNDAEATIAGEVLAGAGKGYQNVMGITLGTGFGSAHCINNITQDINLGSEPFKNTIADDILSTRWFLKQYYEATGISAAGVKELALIAEESKVSRDIFSQFAVNLSDFLEAPIERLKPEVLIVCGNIARASKLFLPYVKKRLTSTTIITGELGENAALIGAAGLFENTPVNQPITINQ